LNWSRRWRSWFSNASWSASWSKELQKTRTIAWEMRDLLQLRLRLPSWIRVESIGIGEAIRFRWDGIAALEGAALRLHLRDRLQVMWGWSSQVSLQVTLVHGVLPGPKTLHLAYAQAV